MTLAPSVDGVTARDVKETSALLQADVRPNSQPTSYHFEYGTSTSYGSQTPAASAGSGAADVAVAAAINNLAPATLYHARLVASNAAGTSYGPDRTLTTGAPSLASNPWSPLRPSASADRTDLPPVLGRTALARVVSGSVFVRTPGSSIAISLTAARDVPMGSLIDARNGTVVLTVALDRRAHTQSATLWGGEFVIHQAASGSGLTTFALAGRRLCRRGTRHHATFALAAKAKARTGTPSLWARDNHGRFGTRGQNSVATVRGTYWGTVERCDGTLTVVRNGAVSVHDMRRHRTVLVTAGHSYLARV